MKISIVYIGRDKKNHHASAIQLFEKRINRYMKLESIQLVPPRYPKTLTTKEIQSKEAELLMDRIQSFDQVMLIDEEGMTYSSLKFADFVQVQMSRGIKNLCLVIGGAYGFAETIKRNYPKRLSLSDLTMSHHLARLVLLEQLYRAFTIINNEPYHNQ